MSRVLRTHKWNRALHYRASDLNREIFFFDTPCTVPIESTHRFHGFFVPVYTNTISTDHRVDRKSKTWADTCSCTQTRARIQAEIPSRHVQDSRCISSQHLPTWTGTKTRFRTAAAAAPAPVVSTGGTILFREEIFSRASPARYLCVRERGSPCGWTDKTRSKNVLPATLLGPTADR